MGPGPGGGGDERGQQGDKVKVPDDVSGGNRGKRNEMEQRMVTYIVIEWGEPNTLTG